MSGARIDHRDSAQGIFAPSSQRSETDQNRGHQGARSATGNANCTGPAIIPPSLAALTYRDTDASETMERLRARAASALVASRSNGFRDAKALLSSIVREDPSDWRTHACLAFIDWCDVDTSHIDTALSAMLLHAPPKQTALLMSVHDLVERTLTECQFATDAPATNERAAIVVLGKQLTPEGGMDPDLRERLDTALALARACPHAPIVLSGGPTAKEITECKVMENWLVENGIPPDRLRLDDLSMVTTANASRALSLLLDRPDIDSLRLVTSAGHVRRASAIFGIELLKGKSRLILKPVIAGGGTLNAPADRNERIAVYLDAMRACELIAYRGRPRFYQDADAIGDDIPGDPQANVRVELSAPNELGQAPAWRNVMNVTTLQRGELVRGTDGALLARLLSAYDVMPSGWIHVSDAETKDPEKAVIDALGELGLKHSRIIRARDSGDNTIARSHGLRPGLSVEVDRTSVEAMRRTKNRTAQIANTIEPSTLRAPLIETDTGAGPPHPSTQSSTQPKRVKVVVGGPRFLAPLSGPAKLNGTVHAVDLDSISERAAASCDELRVHVDDWSEFNWQRLGNEAIRQLRVDGRLTVTTGRKPHVPRAAIIETLKSCGFGKVLARATFQIETPFHPVISDPSAGGVTFECVRESAIAARPMPQPQPK